MEDVQLGDIIQMRKLHPCGNDQWKVIRTGADIKIRCLGCGRIVMLDREVFFRRRRRLVERPAQEPLKGEHNG